MEVALGGRLLLVVRLAMAVLETWPPMVTLGVRK